MPTPLFVVKQGDRKTIETTLTKGGIAQDLTGVPVVVYLRRRATGALKINGAAATVQDPPTSGKVYYELTAADTDTPGDYDLDFKGTFAGGKPVHFPDDGHIRVVVLKAVG